MKKLSDIAWNVTEPEYRKDKALSYSTLSKYEREGFEALFGPSVKTSSLTYGSVVDTMVTDGMDAYKDKYIALPLHSSPSIQLILNKLAKNITSQTLYDVDKDTIVQYAKTFHYGDNWKTDTIYRKLVNNETDKDYQLIQQALSVNPCKEIITTSVYDDAIAAVTALKTSPNTKWYFAPDSQYVEHYYQLKFKGTLNQVDYRCMADLIIVLPDTKQIIPCDLKTTGHPEIMFWDSFHKWYYFYQAKLYWNLIRQTLDNDSYFKDFNLLPYKFIVVNKTTLNPMVYTYDETELTDYTYNGITFRNPLIVGQELRTLLNKKEEEMNKTVILNALDKVMQGVYDIKTALADVKEQPEQFQINLTDLAKSVAFSYKTTKYDLGAHKLLLNIKEMANSDKCKILLKWLDGITNQEDIKKFRTQPLQTQQQQLIEAIKSNESVIENILALKYGGQ